MKPTLVALVSLLVVMTSLASIAVAQDASRIDGRVQWISGVKMLVIPRAGGPSVSADLSRIPLEQYTGLREGDPVRVNGVFSTDGRKLIATEVRPIESREDRVDNKPVTIPTPSAVTIPAPSE